MVKPVLSPETSARDGGGRAGPRQAGPADRIAWVDAAKGLGMVAVAAGHVWWRPGPVHSALYAFHMPLFFLLAGYVFRPKPMADFTRRQLVGIGLPYLSFLLILWAFDCWWESRQGYRPVLAGWEGLKRLAHGGTALSGPFTVFWFAPCLLVARLAQNAVAQAWPDPLSWRWAGLAFAGLIAGTALGMAFRDSPLGLLTVPAAFFLLWAGHALRALALPRWSYWAALVPAAAIFAMGWSMNMKQADYGVPILSMLGAIAISLLVFRLAEILPGARFFAPLGTASLVVMFVHVPIIHYVGGMISPWLMLPLSLALSWLVYRLLALHWWTSLVFLGKLPRRRRPA